MWEVVMVFRAFLEQRRFRPRRGRAHLGSLVLHLAALLTLALAARELRREEPMVVPTPTLAVSLIAPRPAAALGASVRPPSSGPRRAPRVRHPAVPRESAPAAAPAVEMPTGPPPGEIFIEPAVASEGLGAGPGDGPIEGEGGGSVRGRRPELFARVIGGGIPTGAPARGDRRFVSLKEATTLRTHDYFPRLPAAWWPERGPYVVAIELCVSEEGRVSEAALRSRASARLDPVVLAAVRGWRYRPRVEGGKPSPFCHGVVIKYERIY
jgi:hypothetical protein